MVRHDTGTGTDSPWCEMGHSHPQARSHSVEEPWGLPRAKGVGKSSSYQCGAIASLSHPVFCTKLSSPSWLNCSPQNVDTGLELLIVGYEGDGPDRGLRAVSPALPTVAADASVFSSS